MILLLAVALAAHAESSQDKRFVEGLQSRRLFALAERICKQRLMQSNQTDDERATFTRELIRTYALHAAHSPAEKRDDLWQKMELAAEHFLLKYPQHPQALLVRLQYALGVLHRGELSRLEAELAANPSEAIEQARGIIRDASRLMESLDQEIVESIPLRRRTEDAQQLTADELSSLLNHVRLERARLSRNQALSYPAGSPDRLAALSLGLEQLVVPLRETTMADALGSQVRLEAAILRRLVREFDVASQLLQELEKSKIAESLRWSVRAETVRIALDRQQPREALQVVVGAGARTIASPEFDFASLETFLALWQVAADSKDDVEAKKWREQSIEMVDRIEQIHGAYWGRRAEIYLVRTGAGRSGGNVDILERAADDLYLKGRKDEARTTYDKAASAAVAAGDHVAAFKLAYRAALIEQQEKRFASAADRFRKLALSAKDQPQAANAHLLAVVNAGQLWKADPSQRDGYQGVLEEHIAQWPQSSTTAAANLWLGALHELDRDWQQALSAYQSVTLDSQYADEAVQGADRCWGRRLEQLASSGEDVTAAASEAAKWFEKGVSQDGGVPQMWTALQRAMLVAACRIRLVWTKGPADRSEQLLVAGLRGDPAPSEEWAKDARLLLILALAKQPSRIQEANQAMSQLRTARPDEWLWLAARLQDAAKGQPDERQRELARLQLAVLERLPMSPTNLNATTRREIGQLRAHAYHQSGNSAAAIRELVELAREFPKDGDIQEELAGVYLASSDRSDWQRGLDTWRLVASKSEPRSQRWFRAKYYVAFAQKQLGDKASAAKLIQYLQATEDLARSGLEQEFLQLLAECQTM